MFPMLMNLLAERPEISDDGQPITWLGIGEGLVYALIGFIVTFLGVALLIFFVWAYGRIIKGVTPGVTAWNKKYQAKKAERAAAREAKQEKKKAAKAGIVRQPAAEEAEDGIPVEIRLAIVAAVAAYYENEKTDCEFKVRRIRRL